MDGIDFAIASPKKRYEQVVESLEKVLMRSAPDAKLPPEQELAERFGVSKPVIREALTVLKERGLVQSRNGDGSYVSRPNTDAVTSAIGRIITCSSISDSDLHQTRLVLETAVSRLAAPKATQEDVADLEALLDAMDDPTLPLDAWLNVDMDFHVAIARIAGNDLLKVFVEVMMCLLEEYMRKGLHGENARKSTLREHRKVLAAIRTGDPERCEQAIHSHLLSAWNNVGDYQQSSKTETTAT